MIERRRRLVFVLVVALFVWGGSAVSYFSNQTDQQKPDPTHVQGAAADKLAVNALQKLAVKGRAPKTGYSREQFSNGWGVVGNCDMRNLILRRDLTKIKVDVESNCTILSGVLNDPYTGKTIQFVRGQGTSNKVQIDHVVAVSDAWQKGAQQLPATIRYDFYNDPLNLLAVSGAINQAKGDSDAATWLPPNKSYRCRYVARQIAVKVKYTLWVTLAERDAIKRVLERCPDQQLPQVR